MRLLRHCFPFCAADCSNGFVSKALNSPEGGERTIWTVAVQQATRRNLRSTCSSSPSFRKDEGWRRKDELIFYFILHPSAFTLPKLGQALNCPRHRFASFWSSTYSFLQIGCYYLDSNRNLTGRKPQFLAILNTFAKFQTNNTTQKFELGLRVAGDKQ